MATPQSAEAIVENISKVIIGKRFQIELIVKAMIAGGHVLLEDIPGTGKTTITKALATSTSLSFSRIQFTPDLLPSDITGISIYNEKNREFEFQKGPIFAQIILADEINRASPKTQSALLEVMEEHQVSESGTTYKLLSPFTVLATQNPLEYEGTFKLPEAQLDRFLIRISLGYPDKKYEHEILSAHSRQAPLTTINSVATADDLLSLQQDRTQISIHEKIIEYLVSIADLSRNHKYLALGASTRAMISLQKMAQANALFNGRDYVIPEDVRDNIVHVLSHRITLSPLARSSNITEADALHEIINTIPVPGLKF